MSELSPLSHKHINVGTDTYVQGPSGPIRFTPSEKAFLVAFDSTHDPVKAAEAIGKEAEWGLAFFKKPKVAEWASKIAAEESAKQGMSIRWVRHEMMSVYLGKYVWWEGECSTCHVKVKTYTEPESDKGVLMESCYACSMPVLMNRHEEPCTKDRQQMVALQEIASRVDPKIERVQHEFESAEYVFLAREDKDDAS